MMMTRRQIESNDSSDDADPILGMEVITGKPGICFIASHSFSLTIFWKTSKQYVA
jgi:hypothetical protein